MSTLEDLYVSYCRRRGCKPNSSLSHYLQEEYDRHGQQRVLERIDLSQNYVGKKGIIPVLDLVKNVKTVRKLNTSNNMLEHEQLDHLVYCLALHPSMEEVDISNNCLHDGSLDHILKLLEANSSITHVDATGNDFTPSSLARIADKLEKNKIQKADRQKDAPHPDTGKYFRAQLQASLDRETSGGHTHFSTWWKNPQYIMRTSRRSRVRIVMDVRDAKPARQAGFLVFHTDGIRKVVEASADCVAAESSVDHSHCHVTMVTEEDTVYAIMPYTFYPERAMDFTLTAELCNDDPTVADGWVTLEVVDPELDWLVYSADGEWTSTTAGGSPAHHSWCRNPMLRLQYAGSTHAYRMASPATVMVKLSKSVDPDTNDDRHIGFDVVTLDAAGNDKPPISRNDEYVKCTCPHEHCTTVNASFVVPCAALDLFVVPSTEMPGELGSYTVTVFSAVPLTLTTSAFPHGWNYRAVTGVWNECNCGGSREYSMSWKSNPSAALSFDTSQSPPDITVFMESSLPHTTPSTAHDSSTQPSAEESEMTLTELQEKKELQDFMRRHQVDHMEGCVSIIEASPPFYRALYSSEYSGGSVAHLAVPRVEEEFYILATTRYAGQLGDFTLHIFSSHPFVVDGVETLALRERQSQMMQYAEENQARQAVKSMSTVTRRVPEEDEEMIVTRNEILRRCMTTGEKYVDRDFPCGGSSLWLDPEAKAPSDFPKQIVWRRPTDLNERVVFLQDWKCDCPFPYSRRDWFASVTHAIATKPEWIQILAVGYDVMKGMAQFRFFKDGKWTVVTIDDNLPSDSTTELCMGRPATDKADFFFPLLEKAYAKLHRCYEALERKVTPELGVVEVMCQGLMDLSGFMTVSYPLSGSNKLVQEEQDKIWMKLKNAVKPDVLFSLLLLGESSGATERGGLGILSDHLYPVLDARFIEGQRLVKLRHWGQTAEIQWCGKWRPNSKNWTGTLREILQFKEEDKETFWLSFDEVLFYFTNLIMTAGTSSSCWVSADFSNSPKCSEGRLSCGSQFSLQLGDFPPDVKKLQITLGLHQLDPRARVLRHKGALATYRTAIGMAVVATEDNTVWLKELQENGVVRRVEPCKRRDTFCPLMIDIENVVGKKRLTLIAFKEDQRAPNVTCLLSAWSESCSVALVPMERDTRITVDGEWPSGFPIGPPFSSSWRNCPQYFVFPSQSTDVSLFLRQEVPVGQPPKPIGFTVHRATACRSYLEYDPETVILLVKAEASPFVGGTVRLFGMKERRGMPYIIVPFCTDPVPGGKFHIETVANRSLKLCRIDPRLDWCRERQNASFSLADGSVGGSPRFSSWRSSPQFALTFPLGGQGRVFIATTNDNANDTLTEIGMLLVQGDNQWENGQRRKLVISPEDIIARSEEKIGEVSIDCQVDVLPGCSLVLIVYASMPYREADVTVDFFSASAMEVSRVKEWQQVAMVEGSWELGYTAGGGAEAFGNWINNPFFALNTFRQTQIVALLLQYPRGPEKPIVKRAGKKKALLPPIIINPNNRMEIAVDLNAQDSELTPIATTPYTRNSEVTLVASVPSADSLPFVFVPHTKFPEGNGDFKLFVYADSMIELNPLSKERIPYV
ncbi:calpain cysteine peptidase [Trypanosoma grayi]|uniref:calpain cysteine peptidase n=1 Tax=Trypanosoma grayi TaxID=71804 RepID=UPI0004F4B706|nr:calpain cysteine peptidase [Trypanosoma grayi]KEG14503.1 calpain cysteine peptidase [Trypanosoma grayi]